jgi:hypothetical protein
VTSINVTTNASGEFDFGVNANNAYVMCAFASAAATLKIDVYKAGTSFYGKALTIAGGTYNNTAIKVFFLKYYV